MNETDITPELYAQIIELFNALMAGDADLADLLALIDAGAATHADAHRLASIVGADASAALQAIITADALPDGRLYYNIAEGTVAPVLQRSHEIVSTAAGQVQQTLNERARIGIKPIIPALNNARVLGLLFKLSGAEDFTTVSWLLGAPIQNFAEAVADDVVRENVDFHARAGLAPKIHRKAAPGCCPWCAAMAGSYDYPNVPKDIYRRHERCSCTVEYDPADTLGRVQDVWTKRWHDPDAGAKIEYRKTVGLK